MKEREKEISDTSIDDFLSPELDKWVMRYDYLVEPDDIIEYYKSIRTTLDGMEMCSTLIIGTVVKLPVDEGGANSYSMLEEKEEFTDNEREEGFNIKIGTRVSLNSAGIIPVEIDKKNYLIVGIDRIRAKIDKPERDNH